MSVESPLDGKQIPGNCSLYDDINGLECACLLETMCLGFNRFTKNTSIYVPNVLVGRRRKEGSNICKGKLT